ncbi:MAG: galactokinase, partial [Firmicutes bacterium]|nr:galactokinase [Bacillota bacterium]
NGGSVLPAALSFGTLALARERSDTRIRIASATHGQAAAVGLQELAPGVGEGFARYVFGVLWALREEGVLGGGGLDVRIAGDMPEGGGLSSSASLQTAVSLAVAGERHPELTADDWVRICRRAENDYVGVASGVMDFFAVVCGRREHALLLDTATLARREIPVRLPEHAFVVLDTRKQRGLAESKYNERRAQCDSALADLRRQHPQLAALCALTPEQFEAWAGEVRDDVNRRRARHAVTEQARTLQAAVCLEASDARGFGRLMDASHASLMSDYEVTGEHLDAIVAAARKAPGCLGARMTGAGFGGCAVALIERSMIDAFAQETLRAYEQATGVSGACYLGDISDGAQIVTQEVNA